MSTWQEERRANRAAEAEIRRADRDAEAERRRADLAAAVKRRQDAKDAARDRRTKLAKSTAAWISAHTIDLLFVPVIFVPALLAWSAIAGFGHDLYGAPGWTMPLYSEAAMWAFAFALGAARRTGRPVRRLLIGLWFSAAVSATLAFLHGLTATAADGTATGSVTDGIVMALVAVGGVVVHQLVDTAATAPPRLTREQRAALRLQRLAERRVVAVRRAAVRQAAANLAADGTATLVHAPGIVRLHRRFRVGRVRLVPTVVAGLPVTGGGDTVADTLAAEIAEYLAALPDDTARPDVATLSNTPPAEGGRDGAHPAGKAETPTDTDADKIARYVGRTRAAIDGGRLPDAPSAAQVRKFLRCRAEDAAAVHRVLFPRHNGPDDDGPRQEVTA